MATMTPTVAAITLWSILAASSADELDQPPNSWVKRSPLTSTPISPRLGYEGACAWDSKHRVLIRYGGHNQGGGGEQHSEIWTFDPLSVRWTLHEPNTSPPGICCGQQNVFDSVRNRYIRFPSFSGSHGWQWWREIYLNDSSVWTYDLATNTWRNMRPLPTATPRPLRCASWDSARGVVVLFGGETSSEGTLVYDPHVNSWTRMMPTREPESRSGGNMAYDAARRLHVLFGSQFTNDPHTWTYDLAKNEWRDMQPPSMPATDKNDAVLTYDPVARVVIAIVKISEGTEENARSRLETWTYDASTNRWMKQNPAQEPDASGNRARVLTFAPELGLAILENRTHPPHGPSEQQIWTYRVGGSSASKSLDSTPAPRVQPAVVEDAVLSVVSTDRVELTWQPLTDPNIAGYVVERARVDVLSEDQLLRLKVRTPPLAEPSVGAIRRVSKFERLTPQPIDVPRFLDTTVRLADRAAGFNEPIFERNFGDDQLDATGRPYRFAVYAYRVIAVSRTGQHSGPSPAFFTIPSVPQRLFSREDGLSCLLKWSPNPEVAIRGYRVYRMDGRYDKEPLPRLTAEPIPVTQFTDSNAGKSTRRYYVVAVDAIGQEGLPSSPVWYRREWEPFYKPFIGEWHQ